jgi:hypothetical protein
LLRLTTVLDSPVFYLCSVYNHRLAILPQKNALESKSYNI